jgi:hypothetical protein
MFMSLQVQADFDTGLAPAFRVPLTNVGNGGIELGAPDAVPVGNYEIVVTHQDGTVTRHGCFETDSDAINFAMLNRKTLGLDRCKWWYVATPPPVDAPTGLGSSIKMSYFESFTKVDEKARHDFFERPWISVGGIATPTASSFPGHCTPTNPSYLRGNKMSSVEPSIILIAYGFWGCADDVKRIEVYPEKKVSRWKTEPPHLKLTLTDGHKVVREFKTLEDAIEFGTAVHSRLFGAEEDDPDPGDEAPQEEVDDIVDLRSKVA